MHNHKIIEKEKAVLLGILKKLKATTQANWNVPINPGEEGSETPKITKINKNYTVITNIGHNTIFDFFPTNTFYLFW